MNYTLDAVHKILSPNPRSYRFSIMFSSRSLIILHSTLRYMFHFELIFVKGARFLSKFFLHKDVQLFQPPLKKTILSSRSFYATKANMNICFPIFLTLAVVYHTYNSTLFSIKVTRDLFIHAAYPYRFQLLFDKYTPV